MLQVLDCFLVPTPKCPDGPGLPNQGPILAFAESAFAEDPWDPRDPWGFSPMADFIGFPYLDETPFCIGVPVWGSQILYKPWRLAFRKHVEHWKAGRKCVWKRPSCKMCRYIRYLLFVHKWEIFQLAIFMGKTGER